MDYNNNMTFRAFPELVKFKISYCQELKEWEDVKPEDDDIIVMPKLEILEFVSCPKFEKAPLKLLSRDTSAPPLKRLVVAAGKLLENSTFITSMPYITILHLDNMKVTSLPPLGKLTSLEKLYIRDLADLEFISREFLGINDQNKKAAFFPNLTELLINGCNNLTGWEDLEPEDEIILMPKLQILVITRCPVFEVLPCRLLCNLSSLNKLVIPSCEPTFTLTMVDGVGGVDGVDGVNGAQQMKPNLECFRISRCKGTTLPNSILSLKNLKRLTLHDGENVSSLPALGTLEFLEELYIRKFLSLESIGRDFLGIDNPSNNNNTVEAFPKLVKLDLEYLDKLNNWEDIKKEDKYISVMPKLQVLEIRYCGQLQKLPRRLLCGAASLQMLNFHNNSHSLTQALKNDEELLMKL